LFGQSVTAGPEGDAMEQARCLDPGPKSGITADFGFFLTDDDPDWNRFG